MLKYKDYCDYGLIVELEQLGMPIKIDFARSIGNSQLVKTKFYPNPPSLYEAQKFLREEKGIGITIFHNYYHDTREMYYQVELYNTKHHLKTFGEFSDWTQALSEGIKEAVKILKDGQTN